MPQATNFTIKDGSLADTLFTNVQPAGGSLPATYFARAKGAIPLHQPVINISASGKQNGARTTKQTVKTPILQTDINGVTKVVDYAFTEISTTMPGTASVANRTEHWAFVANSCDIAQVADSHKDGYPPN